MPLAIKPAQDYNYLMCRYYIFLTSVHKGRIIFYIGLHDVKIVHHQRIVHHLGIVSEIINFYFLYEVVIIQII